MPRRFCTAADSLAFARRLQRTHERTPPPPVPRVLRRWTQTIVQRLWLPLHFALQLIQRATLAWHAPRAAALPWAPAAPGEIRERFHLSTRLLERSLRVVRTEHTRMLPHAAPVAIGPAMTAAPVTRALTTHRVERQAFFPRVSQVVMRPRSASEVRVEEAPQVAVRALEQRLVPRTDGHRASARTAAVLAPAELSRVTEHVIGELDRRVLSYRERTGRV